MSKSIKKKVCLYIDLNDYSEFKEDEILFCDGGDYKVIDFEKTYNNDK